MRGGRLVIIVESHLYSLLMEVVAVQVLMGRSVLLSSLVLIFKTVSLGKRSVEGCRRSKQYAGYQHSPDSPSLYNRLFPHHDCGT
jgi:hypothetical protein